MRRETEDSENQNPLPQSMSSSTGNTRHAVQQYTAVNIYKVYDNDAYVCTNMYIICIHMRRFFSSHPLVFCSIMVTWRRRRRR